MQRPDLAVVAGGRFPDQLVEGARSVLRKYGYRHLEDGQTRSDWPEMWELLKGDFVAAPGTGIPAYAALSAELQEAARTYMERRLIADHLLDKCREAHAALYREGIDPVRVEAYADAREAYEQSVEAFGAAREAVEAVRRR
jgi:hypothetical protein